MTLGQVIRVAINWPAGFRFCTLEPDDHGHVELPGGFSGTVPCNGWPCKHVRAQLRAEGRSW